MRHKKALFYSAALLGVIAAAIFLYSHRAKVSRIVSPFLLSVPLVYIVKPISDRLADKKIPVGLSILMVYLFFLSAIVAMGVFFVPELAANIRELSETLPELVQRYEQIINGVLSAVKSSNWSVQVKDAIFGEIENLTTMANDLLAKSMERILGAAMDIARIAVDLTLAMVIAFYVIKDGEKFRDFALFLMPRRSRVGLAGTGKEISRVLAGFIQGQLMTALIVGILETIGLMLINMKYPLVLGMIGGLGNVIPYFGPYIGAIPAVALALTVSPLKAVWTIAVFMVVQQIDNNLISTKLIGGKLGLHPVATIFAVLAGGEFFGIPGMLLAVPTLAIIRVIVNRIVETIA
ncbi:MAG: AI-2E family transporter [Acetivibrionales bacterium]